jgi:hypothetical protein
MPASHRGAAASDFVPAVFFRGRVFSNPLGLGSRFDHAARTAGQGCTVAALSDGLDPSPTPIEQCFFDPFTPIRVRKVL